MEPDNSAVGTVGAGYDRDMDLIIIIALSLLVLPLVLLASGPIRIALGVIFVLFFPGYTLIAALFPRKDVLDSIERLALGLGLSIAIVPLTGLVLNYSPWGIRLEPVLFSLLGFILVMSAVALRRRRKLSPEERFEVTLKGNISRFALGWKEGAPRDRLLTIALAAAILFAVGAVAYTVLIPKAGEAFSEFYILGPGGKAEGYPTEITLGDEGKVIAGIVNREHETVVYSVTISTDGDTLAEISPIHLEHEEQWEQEVSFTPPRAGQDQKVEFLLYRENRPEPYQRLHLWIDINPNQQAGS